MIRRPQPAPLFHFGQLQNINIDKQTKFDICFSSRSAHGNVRIIDFGGKYIRNWLQFSYNSLSLNTF